MELAKAPYLNLEKNGILQRSGLIAVNGVDVSEIHSEDLSRQISYLNENVSLFSG